MKNKVFMFSVLVCLVVPAWANHTVIPSHAMGLLTVPSMTQGQFFWFQGRVGEGKYVSVDENGTHCSVDVPVAVGSMGSAGIGVSEVHGLSIVVTSTALSDAILQGVRISSQDWSIADGAQTPMKDGYILSGISPAEGFVLNSQRRWVSWLLNDKPTPMCL